MSRWSSDVSENSSSFNFWAGFTFICACFGTVVGLLPGMVMVIGLAVGILTPIVLVAIVALVDALGPVFDSMSNYFFNETAVKQGFQPECSLTNTIENSVSTSARLTTMLNARSADRSVLSRDDRREDLDGTQSVAVEPVKKRTYAEAVANKQAGENMSHHELAKPEVSLSFAIR